MREKQSENSHLIKDLDQLERYRFPLDMPFTVPLDDLLFLFWEALIGNLKPRTVRKLAGDFLLVVILNDFSVGTHGGLLLLV